MRPPSEPPPSPRPEWTRESAVLRLPGVTSLDDLSPEWAWGGATGAGARVAVIDSGIEAHHPDLGGCVDVEGGVVVALNDDGEPEVMPGPHDDLFGHGTACAGIIHEVAPEATITSVRVLGTRNSGMATVFLTGLAWAVEQGFDVINLSLGTGKRDWALPFYELCDQAYFRGALVVTAANNLARPSFPSLFASVTSVACNLSKEPFHFHFNPEPPTEFLAPGIDVEVSWRGGGRQTATGNSFAAPAPGRRRGADQVEAPGAAPLPDEDGAVGHRVERAHRGDPCGSPDGRADGGRAETGQPGHGSAPLGEPRAMTLDRDRIIRALPSYEIGDEIGRGAWGIVVVARHRQLGRSVAVKELPAAFASDPGVRRRFHSEARLLAALDHPHIVPIYDYVEDEGLCLLVMELLAGGTVWSRFTTEGVSAATACSIVVAACSALHHAHGSGVLHRDIKPENLLFSGSETLKVSDFGIAKVVGGAASMGTRTGEVLGTPAYMAPEQALGHDLTPATDVYALGTVLYELLSGRLPFSDDGNAIALLYRHVHEDPKPLAELRPDLPPALVDVTMRAIARDPADRYATAEEFGVAVAEAATGAWGAGWVRSGGVNVIATGRIGERLSGPGPSGERISTPPRGRTRSTRVVETVADAAEQHEPAAELAEVAAPDDLVPLNEIVPADPPGTVREPAPATVASATAEPAPPTVAATSPAVPPPPAPAQPPRGTTLRQHNPPQPARVDRDRGRTRGRRRRDRGRVHRLA